MPLTSPRARPFRLQVNTRQAFRRWALAALMTGAVVVGNGTPARAQSASPTADASPVVRPAVVSASLAQTAAKKPKKKKEDWGFKWEDHPTLRLGAVRLGFRARLQEDRQASDAPLGNADQVTRDEAKKRIGIDGQVVKYADFQIERELADDVDPWRDVYINYSQFDFAQVQYGKFKIPFSLDENTSATSLDFVNRSLAANTLAPGRDIGVMVHGRLLARRLRYEYGSFDHDGRNAAPRPPTERVIGGVTRAGRLTVEPFHNSKSEAADFQVGLAFTTSTVPEGFSGIRGQTVLGSKFYAADYLVQGDRKRFGLETRWRPGPFSLQAEYIKTTEARIGESVEDDDLTPIRALGWYLSGMWAVTGDKKANGLENSKHAIGKGGIGAVEVAGRTERLTFDSEPTGDLPSTSVRSTVIVGNSDKVTTIGVNWYPVRWVKIQFNWIRETLTAPELGPVPALPSFSSRVLRFQFAL